MARKRRHERKSELGADVPKEQSGHDPTAVKMSVPAGLGWVSPDKRVHTRCGSCDALICVPLESVGKEEACSECGKSVLVPWGGWLRRGKKPPEGLEAAAEGVEFSDDEDADHGSTEDLRAQLEAERKQSRYRAKADRRVDAVGGRFSGMRVFWEDFTRTLTDHWYFAVAGVVVVLIAGGVWLMLPGEQSAGPKRSADASKKMAYFYDMANDTLFLGPATATPPIPPPSEGEFGLPTGALANVFGCGDCSKENLQVVWLQVESDGRQTDAAGNRFERGQVLIKKVEDKHWVSIYDPTSNQLRDVSSLCKTGEAQRCLPPDRAG